MTRLEHDLMYALDHIGHNACTALGAALQVDKDNSELVRSL